jgi:cyclic beta-1,2-glucan synthetase
LGRRWSRRVGPIERPLRDELLSIEALEARAMALAGSFTLDPNTRRRARTALPRFEDNVRFLTGAYRTLADDLQAGQFIPAAAEWLLDNFHLITAEITGIRPRTYYRRLPALATRAQAGHARIFAMAIELVRHSDSRLESQKLVQFLKSYQRVAPLTIGELWAWPSMLKLALIENLRRLAEELMRSRAERRAADAYLDQTDDRPPRTARSLPNPLDPTFAVQLLHRLREYGPCGPPWTNAWRSTRRRPRT